MQQQIYLVRTEFDFFSRIENHAFYSLDNAKKAFEREIRKLAKRTEEKLSDSKLIKANTCFYFENKNRDITTIETVNIEDIKNKSTKTVKAS